MPFLCHCEEDSAEGGAGRSNPETVDMRAIERLRNCFASLRCARNDTKRESPENN